MRKRTCKKLRFLSRTVSWLLILALLVQDALGSGSITFAAMQQEDETKWIMQ